MAWTQPPAGSRCLSPPHLAPLPQVHPLGEHNSVSPTDSFSLRNNLYSFPIVAAVTNDHKRGLLKTTQVDRLIVPEVESP